MTTRQQKQELVKLRILSFLRAPAQQEFGALGQDIRRGIQSERMVTQELMLGVLVDDGLVERRNDTKHKSAKPYFITPKGTAYLDEQARKAIFPEFAAKANWASKDSEPRLEETVFTFVRTLPEFRDAGDERIKEVSLGFSRAVREHISRAL